MRAPGLAGLTRHARRHRAVPVGTVEDFPVRGAVTLHVIPTPARGIDRVAVAATGDPGKVERGGDGVAEHRAVQRAPGPAGPVGAELSRDLGDGVVERGE